MTNEEPEKEPPQATNELAGISENATANIRFSKRLKLQKELLKHFLTNVSNVQLNSPYPEKKKN